MLTPLFSNIPLMPLGKREKFATRELGVARSYLADVFWPHTLARASKHGGIDFRHQMAELSKNMSLHALTYGREITNDGEPSDNSYLVIFTLDGKIEIEGSDYSMTSKPGTVCVMNPDRRFRSRLSADHKQLTIKIAGTLINECFENALGCPPSAPIKFVHRPVAVETQASSLGNMVNTLCAELNKERSPLVGQPLSLHIERVLAGVLIEELTHNLSTQLNNRLSVPPPRCVRSAQNYIYTHARENITIQEIADFSHVTPRSLQIGFRKYLHVTPVEYLRNVRLDLAHEALSKGPSQGLTVTNIALDCGFSSSSKFAEYYRARFGCPPSDVLHGRSAHHLSPSFHGSQFRA